VRDYFFSQQSLPPVQLSQPQPSHLQSSQPSLQAHFSQVHESPQQHAALATSTALVDVANPSAPVAATTRAVIKNLDIFNSP
jgi:hypothetical protein